MRFSKKGSLSREDLRFYEKYTEINSDEIQKVHKYFLKMSPEGKMTKPQFMKIYKKFFPYEKEPRDNCEHVFRTFDTDANGHISFNEFLFSMNVLSSGSPKQKLSLLFHMYDVNGDGIISVNELIIIVESIFKLLTTNISPIARHYMDSPAQRAKKVFEKLDCNNDKKITMSEFCAGCSKDLNLLKLLTSNTSPIALKR